MAEGAPSSGENKTARIPRGDIERLGVKAKAVTRRSGRKIGRTMKKAGAPVGAALENAGKKLKGARNKFDTFKETPEAQAAAFPAAVGLAGVAAVAAFGAVNAAHEKLESSRPAVSNQVGETDQAGNAGAGRVEITKDGAVFKDAPPSIPVEEAASAQIEAVTQQNPGGMGPGADEAGAREGVASEVLGERFNLDEMVRDIEYNGSKATFYKTNGGDGSTGWMLPIAKGSNLSQEDWKAMAKKAGIQEGTKVLVSDDNGYHLL